MKPATRWPLLVCTILGLDMIGAAFVVYFATSDPSFAVEESYYEKAADWDDHAARRAASDRLGWTCTASLTPLPDSKGMLLVCTLLDADAAPVRDAAIAVEAIPIVRASEVFEVRLKAQADGVYAGVVPSDRDGRWELRIAATHELGEFLEHTRVLAGARGETGATE